MKLDDIDQSTLIIAEEVIAARVAAHQKHGSNSIEATPGSDPKWLAILGEEVGEATDEVFALMLNSQLGRISHALTYDADRARLRAELIDVLAVGTAWVASVDRQKRIDAEKRLADYQPHGTLNFD